MQKRIVRLEKDFWRIRTDAGELPESEIIELIEYCDEIKLPYRLVDGGSLCIAGEIDRDTVFERLEHFYDGKAEVFPFKHQQNAHSINDMKPIELKRIVKSVNYVNSLKFNEKITETENIHQSQPHVFLTVLALSHDGVSMEKVEHALNVLLVIHKSFSDDPNGRKISLISKRMLDDALESNIAMLQTIEQGWLSTDESINSYLEKNILAYIVGYLKEKDLLALSEENERLLINLKTVLDSYSNARRKAEPMH